jgi:hypothetical protein
MDFFRDHAIDAFLSAFGKLIDKSRFFSGFYQPRIQFG